MSTIDMADGVGDVFFVDPFGDIDAVDIIGFVTPGAKPGPPCGWPTPAMPLRKFGGMCWGQKPCHKPIFKLFRFCR